MDEAGFHARRKADREAKAAFLRGKLGGINAVQPMQDGQQNEQSALPAHDEELHDQHPEASNAYAMPGYKPPPAHATAAELPGPGTLAQPAPLPQSNAKRQMLPHLQMMTGPMLRYDTVKDGIYHAFLMIVVAASNSDTAPIPPCLLLEWDASAQHIGFEHQFEHLTLSEQEKEEKVNRRAVAGLKIFTYYGLNGANDFWRFKIEVPLSEREEEVFYSINKGPENSFFVPAKNQNMRWVGHSCNGFSGGVDTAAFNGPDPLWRDVLRKHEEKSLHVLIGGGDQLYCDPLTMEPEIAPWINEPDPEKKRKAPLTDDIRLALDRFFFNKYCSWFRSGAFGQAIARIPMLNICDDHDIIDGFGSYDDATQACPIFSTIGARGMFWFLLFQQFIVDEIDGLPTTFGQHPSKSTIIGGPGAWIPTPSHSFLSYLGPQVYICLLDCRSERKKDQICSRLTYDRVFAELRALPDEVDHLVMLLGVPILYPRMGLIEKTLESKWNPMTLAAKTGLMPSAVNKFNKDAELLDDLNDHWCASLHKTERNWFIEELQKIQLDRRMRVTFLSGDVHATCVSKLFTHSKKIEPRVDPRYMLQIVSSAIVNTPPPPPVITMVSTFGKKKHKTLHHADTDEELIPIFETDTDDSKLKQNTVMGRRNYVLVDHHHESGELGWLIQVEVKQGSGTTKAYGIQAPPPGW
ncbi:BZ3500_MvSof-1268-A1-R1_Chr8-1g09834 [Microbotryum saponariae]|uniref:BZ3500_MvSof-1268-A1-R1_Chr8-1g09834 protein n=1 Tax=Microbotryum saponariae TaxID=289078 RepID=A0A2X0MTG8_9BASI|nr:BZ3500_MvSof-1268-A1-R1_Chr8-1g09834 [Microbotryum saponariae]SDA08120.1 BZ3501_MvSof-1269-A2-R1_Chr8-1g09557 [Microbotryum saponariae]